MKLSSISLAAISGAIIFVLSRWLLTSNGVGLPLATVLQSELSVLEHRRELIELQVVEEKLRREVDGRRQAIKLAALMIERNQPPVNTEHLKGNYFKTGQFVNTQSSTLIRPTGVVKQDTTTKQNISPAHWCKTAAVQFRIRSPITASNNWGFMDDLEYRKAWSMHGCDFVVFGGKDTDSKYLPHIPADKLIQSTEKAKQLQVAPTSLQYLKDNNGSPRRKITVIIYRTLLQPKFLYVNLGCSME
jgi:hypothetical protein